MQSTKRRLVLLKNLSQTTKMWSIHPVSSFPSNSFYVQAHSLYLFLILFSLLALCPHVTFGTLPPNLKMKSLEFQGDFDETTCCPPLLFLPPVNSNRIGRLYKYANFLNPPKSSSQPFLWDQTVVITGWISLFSHHYSGIRMKNLIDRSTFWCLLSHRKISIQFSKDESV